MTEKKGNKVTIRDLDDAIEMALAKRPDSAEQIHAGLNDRCTIYDVKAALSIWVRNGWAYRLSNGLYSKTQKEVNK